MRGTLLLSALLLTAPRIDATCENPYIDETPLSDLGTGTYNGYQGGLYPGGVNERPASHDQDYRRTSRLVLLNTAGNPDINGSFVLISIGNSNATMEFSYFIHDANTLPGSNMRRVLVDCADLNQTADVISDPEAPYWGYVDTTLAAAGVTPLQVQSVWLKNAIPFPTEGFPGHAMIYRDDLRAILQILKSRYTNLKSVYLTSRIYGGYAPPNGQNPEPYPYGYGFSVKWLIEEQLQGSPDLNFDPAKGPVLAPWIAWGPYLWADGIHPRSDGLTWECADFIEDGAHPSPLGIAKVSSRLIDFFSTDPTTVPWFMDCNLDDQGTFAKPYEVLDDRMAKVGTNGLQISWTSLDPAVGSGTVYDVVRGRLSELREDQGFARVTCLLNGWADTPYMDALPSPAPGTGYYYLVHGQNSCGSGTWGDSSLVPDPRDALDAGVPFCFRLEVP
jgi:hypothetical protein